MREQASAELSLLVSREQAENAFWNALRMFVGQGKRHSADEVSKGTGIHRRTLDCYRGYPIGHPDHRPLHIGQKMSLASYIGADLTTVWFGCIGQAAYALPEYDPDPGELAADTSEDTARVVRMAADGDLSNDDPATLRETGQNMMRHGAELISIGQQAQRRVRRRA